MIIPSKHSGYGEGGLLTPTRRVYNESQTITQTTIPEYARPYVEQLLGGAAGLTYQYGRDSAGNIRYDASGMPQVDGIQPYQVYQGERQAQFMPLQEQSYAGAQNLGLAPSLQGAVDLAGAASMGAMGTRYQPGYFQNQFNAPQGYQSAQYDMQDVYAPNLQQYQMQGPRNVRGARAQAAQMGNAPQGFAALLNQTPAAQAVTTGATQANAAQLDAAPTYGGVGFNAPFNVYAERVAAERVNAPQLQNLSMQAAASRYDPSRSLQNYRMRPAERVGTEAFNRPETAESYMSPYMQNVVNAQQREAQRAADIQRTQRNAQLTQQGAFGGTRQAVMEAEAQRNLALQMGDIQAAGLQRAYEQAQGAFTSDQARALQAAQANQQAGLTVGGQNLASQLSTQQLGANIGSQYGLANLANQQQANLQNLSAGLQTQGLAAQTGLTAQQLNQAAGMQGQLANQQTGLQAGLANQQMGYNTALQNAQLAQQAGLANQALAGQYGLQQGQFNQAANLQNAQLGTQAGMQGAQLGTQVGLANQALQGQYGLANQQAANQMALANLGLQGQYGMQQGQFGQQANLQNAQLAQQANLANQQMQFGTNTANLNAILGTQQLGSSQNMQAQLANQQMFQNAQQAAEASRQFGYGNQMQAAGLGAQYGQAAQQLAEQSRQYGAGLGMQGYQTALQGAGQLGTLGNLGFNQQTGAIGLQNQLGTQQQQQVQNILNQQYQDFQNQQRYPYQQMAFMSDMLRGLPLSQTASTMYQAPPSTISQLGGLAGAGYMASKMFNKGGSVNSTRSAGLADLAISKIS